ncbi:MAG: hypothetical protein HQK52_08560 [Oligoflexia bacterium]|nr:hypothetical protein [Oligoflexia bacterium]
MNFKKCNIIVSVAVMIVCLASLVSCKSKETTTTTTTSSSSSNPSSNSNPANAVTNISSPTGVKMACILKDDEGKLQDGVCGQVSIKPEHAPDFKVAYEKACQEKQGSFLDKECDANIYSVTVDNSTVISGGISCHVDFYISKADKELVASKDLNEGEEFIDNESLRQTVEEALAGVSI